MHCGGGRNLFGKRYKSLVEGFLRSRDGSSANLFFQEKKMRSILSRVN